MNSPCAPSLWRGFQLFLGKQASLRAFFDWLVFWLIVTGFLLITSPSLFAQTNDNTSTVYGRIAGQARTPALPGDRTTVRRRVTDMLGAVVTGASVTPGNLATGLELVVTTDAKGNFAFAASKGARYRLIVSAVGFAPISREVESSGSFNFALEPAALAERPSASIAAWSSSAPWTTLPTAAIRMWARENWKIQWVRRLSKTANKGGAEAPA
jgi:hypothetical protein